MNTLRAEGQGMTRESQVEISIGITASFSAHRQNAEQADRLIKSPGLYSVPR